MFLFALRIENVYVMIYLKKIELGSVMKREKRERMISRSMVLLPVCVLCALVFLTPFYTLDTMLCDLLYTKLDGVSREIKIIGVDEETLNAYGNFQQWSREKSAELVELLCVDEASAPAVLAFDFMFTGETNRETDNKLAEVCKNTCPIVFASNVVYRGITKQSGTGEIYYDSWNINMVEEAYDALRENVQHGYTNAYIDKNGCVRYIKPFEYYEQQRLESFSWKIYETYQAELGREAVIPETDKAGLAQFFYSGQIGEYSHFSLKNVLDGKIPREEFTDCIVLVGAYAAGMQDAYIAAVERSNPMYGVEIQANIVQALMEGKTAVAVPSFIYLFVAGPLLCLFFWVARRQKLLPVLTETILMMFLHILTGRMLALGGYTIPQLYFLLVLFAIALYFIIEKYFGEKIRRKRMLATFKKYVAPQVVDELAKDDGFILRLGGEKRKIAVLFVDIRGFTPLSESMEPEQVVNILNEYLALTTSCILSQNGMLDKFVGDATMAVFNAPFDLEDYVFRAVKTALDMRAGADELSEKLFQQFGKKVSFGIGVNCGEAVVGNIGCEFRMDYTAIGDTVNTAARLESRAGAGEILISRAVYECLKDRITVEEVGEMTLKGKSNAVMTYRVIGLKENGLNHE